MKRQPAIMNAKDKALSAAIDDMNCGRGKQFYSLLDEFLDITLGLMCNNPNGHQVDTINRLQDDEEYRAAYKEAVTAYGEAADGYHDPFGDMFMERISHGDHGQFFTPESLCKITALVADPHSGYINDPACGSGRLLIAALKEVREKGEEPWISAQDLSFTCAKMTLLNLLIHQARGYVICGDSLRQDRESWTYFKIDRVFDLNGGIVPTYWQYTLTDIDAVDSKREAWKTEQLSRGLWVELFRSPEEIIKNNTK